MDLAALVRAAVAASSALAEQRGTDLGALASAAVAVAVPVRGDPVALTVLLNNLVHNALRDTPAGGVVDVEAPPVAGRPVLHVVDSGPGIAAAGRQRVVDRFYRGPGAAGSAGDGGGSGLGLAIVRAVAERHGASVNLHTAPSGQGLDACVDFPAAA